MSLTAKRPSRDKTRANLVKAVTGVEEKKRLNAEIDECLYKKIKIKAVEDGRSISEITRDLWVEYLRD